MAELDKPVAGVPADNGSFDFDLASVAAGTTRPFDEFTPGPTDDTKKNPVDENKDKGIEVKPDAIADKDKTEEEKKAEADKKDLENNSNEGNELYVNDKGDLVNDKDEVVRKKGTFDYDEKTGQVSYTESSTQQLLSYYRDNGITFKDEIGNDIEFDDSVDSLNKINDIVVEHKSKKVIGDFLAQSPVIKEYILHKQAGGDDNSFFTRKTQVINYENVAYPESDVANRKNVIKDLLTKVYGNPQDIANEMIDAYEAGGKLNDKYTEALSKLKDWQKANETKANEDNQKLIDARNQQTKDYWTKVNTTVKSGNLGLITVPENERESFYNFLSTPVKDNKSLVEIKSEELDINKQLILDYLIYKDFNIDSLIKVKALSMQAEKLGKKVVVIPSVTNSKVPKANQGVKDLDNFGLSNLV